ncbi:lipid A-modifier LpxR family protein [Helicobacter sp. L8]|uniref:lipid A deacylase LpxR family protein n=1 Tax=Helicobacter sp. L8 TaxID=2316078 RepID=UPI000EB1266E|nr:lipid A-modifier LpxR family protein [Helicobacter sp. L8]
MRCLPPLLLLLSALGASSLSPHKKQYIDLLTENDGYINPYIDRYYTAGTRIGWASREYDFSHSKMAWLDYLSLQIKKPKMSRFTLYLTQSMFTPTLEHRALTIPVRGDHLYGGYLRAQLGLWQRSAHTLESIAISMGTTGPGALAGKTQDLIHTWGHDPKFLGWASQIANEFIFEFHYTWLQKLPLLTTRFFSMDMLAGVGMNLGNAITDFKLGSMLRLGYNLGVDFGPNKINTGFSGGMPISDAFSLYIFFGATGKFQPLDVFVQGNSPTTRGITTLPYFLYNAEMGIAIVYKGFRLSFSAIDLSKTFRAQPRNHNIGSIELDIAF